MLLVHVYCIFFVYAVVDHDMRFTNIHTGWLGCVHDARVLRNSSLYAVAEAEHLILVIHDHHSMADSAYPLKNFIITDVEETTSTSVDTRHTK